MNDTTLRAGRPAAGAPWHRQRWPWFLMLGPGIVVIAGFTTLWIAFRSDDGLVADDYYKRGLAVNQTLDRSIRGADLGLSASLDVTREGDVTLRLRSGDNVVPPVVRVRLVHPTRAGLDMAANVVQGPGGVYRGRVEGPVSGRRLVIVETGEWRLGPVEVADVARVHVVLDGADQR